MSTPIFIFGYMHSGTSLLQRMLGKHEKIYDAKGEIKFFDYIGSIKDYINTQQLNEAEILDLMQTVIEKGCNQAIEEGDLLQGSRQGVAATSFKNYSTSDLIKIYFEQFSRIGNETLFFLDKVNMVLLYLDKVLKISPQSKFIFLYRDPRDVLASKKKRMLKTSDDRYPDSEMLKLKKLEKRFSLPLDTFSLSRFYQVYSNVEEQIDKKNIINLTYEELTSTPEKTMQHLCSFLEIEYQPDKMLKLGFNNSADYQVQRKRGVFLNSGTYRSIFSKKEVAFIDLNFSKFYVNRGYQKDSEVRTTDRLLSLTYFVKLVIGLGDRLLSRWRLLGFSNFIKYLSNRINLFLFMKKA